jgi:hypothetical protein
MNLHCGFLKYMPKNGQTTNVKKYWKDILNLRVGFPGKRRDDVYDKKSENNYGLKS